MYDIELVKEMKCYCKNHVECVDRKGNICPHRTMCVTYIEGGPCRKTPKHTSIKIMYAYYETVRKSKVGKQRFHNTGYPFKISTHESGNYYTRLKHYYCFKKGYLMKDEWLDYQNFAKWWEDNIKGKNVSPTLKENVKVINEDSIILKRKITRNRRF